MSFVVVYLIRAREFVVVPENWVLELNTAKLKNYGTNSNQNFLVFWSATCGTPNLRASVDFNATLNFQYRATTNGVCYICRIKKFFGKFVLKMKDFRSLNIDYMYLY